MMGREGVTSSSPDIFFELMSQISSLKVFEGVSSKVEDLISFFFFGWGGNQQ